ncbi:uncharacterized protein [Argopecten irradians]|uniref:uncharacterized protein n=1 Tax=Argopecten irradians TaxID=31199 RepID=UPI003714BEC0
MAVTIGSPRHFLRMFEEVGEVFRLMAIDTNAVKFMSEETLTQFILAAGDRAYLRSICQQGEKSGKREELLNRLKRKMSLRKDEETNKSGDEESAKRKLSKHLCGNKHAQKKPRKIELGWIHNGKQVRTVNGGGKRTIEIDRNAKKEDILSHAKSLFFPNGNSKKGSVSNFTCDLLDFVQDTLPHDITVAVLYDKMKMGILRFYLSTSVECTPGNITATTTTCTPTVTTSSLEAQSDKTVSNDESNLDLFDYLDSVCASDSLHTFDSSTMSTTSSATDGGTRTETIASSSAPVLDDVIFPIFSNQPRQYDVTTHIPTTNVVPNDEIMQFNDVPDTELLPKKTILKIHRVKILEDMLAAFKDPDILSIPLQMTFVNEAGVDNNGVSRDAYTAFWTEFLSRFAEGEEARVPSLNPQWQEEEWKSVGRILTKGYIEHGVLPLMLAPVFMHAMLFGEESVTSESLMDSFALYLSNTDRDIVHSAMADLDSLDDDDRDDLIDLLDRMGSKRVPASDEIRHAFVQMAHKELIQKPKYALDKMSEVARQALTIRSKDTDSLTKIYDNRKPTVKKLLKIISAQPNSAEETQALGYFKQYVKAQNDNHSLSRLLRYLIGSDIMCVEKLEIIFTPLEGLARRPIAHTCGPSLELPFTYQTYPELRSEFDNILSGGKESMEMSIA